jgi:surfeit locus 1 family protein
MNATRKLLWPTLFAAFCLAVLVGLGTWQLERKAWKETLIEQIAERTHAEPITLDAAETLVKLGENLEYTRVRVRGRLHHDKARYLYFPSSQGPGWHVHTPLETPAGKIVMVNRGFVTEAGREQGPSGPVGPAREVDIVGLIRLPQGRGLFAPANDLTRNIWYWRDLDGMVRSAFASGTAGEVLPFFVDAEAQPGGPRGPSEPRAGVTRLDLPNRHLEYAVTWYGLAVALLAVYGVLVVQRFRSGGARMATGAEPNREKR